VPEPTPQPSGPQPEPVPVPEVDDYYFELVASTTTAFKGIYGGAIALTGATNNTITIFGGRSVVDDVKSYDVVVQFDLGTYSFSNFSYWDPDCRALSYSQPPVDSSNGYVTNPIYFLKWRPIPGEYKVTSWDLSSPTSFKDIFNVSEGDPYTQIAALANGNVYVYGKSSRLRFWNGQNLIQINTTSGFEPPPRDAPALAAYRDDLYLQGGMTDTGILLSDFWYYSKAQNEWSHRNSSGIPAATGHRATLSFLGSASYIYFTGLNNSSIVIYNIGSNSTKPTKVDPILTESLTTISGNRLFIYGGKTISNTISNSLYQLVEEGYCISVGDCESCVNVMGCTFCRNALSASAPSCVAGNSTSPYILRTCANSTSSQVISLVEFCPEIFPSWAIALIVIGGVILVGGIVFGIMKLRSGKSGYESVS